MVALTAAPRVGRVAWQASWGDVGLSPVGGACRTARSALHGRRCRAAVAHESVVGRSRGGRWRERGAQRASDSCRWMNSMGRTCSCQARLRTRRHCGPWWIDGRERAVLRAEFGRWSTVSWQVPHADVAGRSGSAFRHLSWAGRQKTLSFREDRRARADFGTYGDPRGAAKVHHVPEFPRSCLSVRSGPGGTRRGRRWERARGALRSRGRSFACAAREHGTTPSLTFASSRTVHRRYLRPLREA